jgi:hypothetical protein
MTANETGTIFSTNSPIWPVLTVLLGVAVGYFLTSISTLITQRKKTKSLATLLAFEIEAIRKIALEAVEGHGKELDKTRSALQQKNGIKRTLAIYTEFQTDIYRRENTDLTLFKDGLAATISELYRWLSQAEQARKMNIQAVEAIVPLLHPKEPVYDEREQKVIESQIKLMIIFGDSFLDKLSHVAELGRIAVKQLKEINRSIDLSQVQIGKSVSAIENEFPYEPAYVGRILG